MMVARVGLVLALAAVAVALRLAYAGGVELMVRVWAFWPTTTD